ncbi:7459_t:CDS:2, partial [Racocetra persica]
VGKYTHPPPPSNHIPEAIKDRLNIMINDASSQLDYTLPEIHASLNNLDQLRYLVGRAQQLQNPYGQGILGIHIHNEDWSYILGDLDFAQAKGLGLALSKIDSNKSCQDEVQSLFNQIKISNENDIEGETTNVAESAHADINREGKGLNLINAIEKALRFDNRKFITCTVQDKYGVAKTEEDSLTLLERQIALEEWRLELEERKEKLREKKLLNYEKARELGVEEELG